MNNGTIGLPLQWQSPASETHLCWTSSRIYPLLCTGGVARHLYLAWRWVDCLLPSPRLLVLMAVVKRSSTGLPSVASSKLSAGRRGGGMQRREAVISRGRSTSLRAGRLFQTLHWGSGCWTSGSEAGNCSFCLFVVESGAVQCQTTLCSFLQSYICSPRYSKVWGIHCI